MRKLVSVLVVSFLMGNAGVAYANYELLVKNNCLACHYVDKRKYGPKLTEIAAKYAGDKKAESFLSKKIRKGGTGVWGIDVMPPQRQVSQADAVALARYILSLKESDKAPTQ